MKLNFCEIHAFDVKHQKQKIAQDNGSTCTSEESNNNINEK